MCVGEHPSTHISALHVLQCINTQCARRTRTASFIHSLILTGRMSSARTPFIYQRTEYEYTRWWQRQLPLYMRTICTNLYDTCAHHGHRHTSMHIHFFMKAGVRPGRKKGTLVGFHSTCCSMLFPARSQCWWRLGGTSAGEKKVPFPYAACVQQ